MNRLLVLILVIGLVLSAQDSGLTLTAGGPAPVSQASAVYSGQIGGTTFFYWVVATYPIGPVPPVTSAVVQNVAVLGGANQVAITWSRPDGATSFDVLRSTTNAFPGSCAACAVATGVTGVSATDTGALTAYTLSSVPQPATGTMAVNNRDFSQVRFTFDRPLSLSTIFFNDGTSQSTAYTAAITAAANRVFAGPTSGAAAAPAFRALVIADMPAGFTITCGSTPGQLCFNNAGAFGGMSGTGWTDAIRSLIFDGGAIRTQLWLKNGSAQETNPTFIITDPSNNALVESNSGIGQYILGVFPPTMPSVTTTPGNQGSLISLSSGNGGITTIATTGVGGAGGPTDIISGNGAAVSTANTSATGGLGGYLNLSSGSGGDTSGTGTNIGGVAGDLTLTSGAGGAAAGGTSNTGGNAGNINIGLGSGGAGATANGVDGSLIVTAGARANATPGVFVLRNNLSQNLLRWSANALDQHMASGVDFAWSSSATDATAAKDAGLARNAAGIVEVNSGTPGTFRDLRLRMPNADTYATSTNCNDNTASPADCTAAAAGSVTIAAGATAVVVNTTAVTANSQVFVTFDSGLGTRLGVTCNTTFAAPFITARTAATSFTITVGAAPAVNPACYSYFIVN